MEYLKNVESLVDMDKLPKKDIKSIGMIPIDNEKKLGSKLLRDGYPLVQSVHKLEVNFDLGQRFEQTGS